MKTALVTAAALVAATSVSAATMQIALYNSDGDEPSPGTDYYSGDSDVQAIVTCDGCSVLYYEGGYGFSMGETTADALYEVGTEDAELFNGPFQDAYGAGNPVEQEVAWINDILGTAYTDGYKFGGGDGEYSSDALYLMIKVGNVPNYTIIRNDTGGELVFSWAGVDGEGAGLSHITAFGGTVVPLPAAGWLLLGGLGGLAAMRRKRLV